LKGYVVVEEVGVSDKCNGNKSIVREWDCQDVPIIHLDSQKYGAVPIHYVQYKAIPAPIFSPKWRAYFEGRAVVIGLVCLY
jgi:hypothetical protein